MLFCSHNISFYSPFGFDALTERREKKPTIVLVVKGRSTTVDNGHTVTQRTGEQSLALNSSPHGQCTSYPARQVLYSGGTAKQLKFSFRFKEC